MNSTTLPSLCLRVPILTLLSWLCLGPFAFATPDRPAKSDRLAPLPPPRELCSPEPKEPDCDDTSATPSNATRNAAGLQKLATRGITLSNTAAFRLLVVEQDDTITAQLLDTTNTQVGNIDIRIWTHVDSPAKGRNSKFAGQPVYKQRGADAERTDPMMTEYTIENYRGFIIQIRIVSTLEEWLETNWTFL